MAASRRAKKVTRALGASRALALGGPVVGIATARVILILVARIVLILLRLMGLHALSAPA